MLAALRTMVEEWADVVAPELVDSAEKSGRAGEMFRNEGVDIVFVFPVGYTPSMNMIPAVRSLDIPLRIVNAHIDRSYDYTTADTAAYLYHEGVCCVPEFAGTLTNMGKKFKVRTGAFADARLQAELRADLDGAAAASFFRRMNIGLIGQVYTHMGDMPIDEHRLMRATGRMLVRPEVEEIVNAYYRVSEDQLEEMYRQFRELYEVDDTVTNEHLRFSAQAAVAFDEIIHKYDIYAFGFYWWGESELVTQLRSQSGLAVSRLGAMGRPGITEGDVKSAMAMKILNLLGGGGIFVEFFSMDFDEDFILMGHDGPSNVNMAGSRPRLKHLEVHHGKSGHGLGIDFEVRTGVVTLVNLTQFDAGETFKLIYTVAEVVPGPTLNIGNPNCRVKVSRPIHEFVEAWCQQGPSHHIAAGHGDHSMPLESFAEAMKFRIVRV
jgi:L-arabinose isomerase